MSIVEIIEKNQGGTVLFLGRVTNFTSEELTSFLEAQGMSYADKYLKGDEIALVVLSTMLTPLEEQASYELYDSKVPDISLAKFEKFYTKHIRPSRLIMSLKLSNDQERLKRLLENESFSDEVYLQLLKMYNWKGEGVHESNNNRDITISLVKRFYRPNGFRDPAMIYAPTTLLNIAQETQDSMLLSLLLTLPNHTIKVSRYDSNRPKNLRETVAFNEAISQESIRLLLSYQDESIDYFLAANKSLKENEQKELYRRSSKRVYQMLAHNPSLIDELFYTFLEEEEQIVQSLLVYQIMSRERIEKIIDTQYLAYVGQNRTIEGLDGMLLSLNNRLLDFELASNPTVTLDNLKKIYQKYGELVAGRLAKNESLSSEIFEDIYTFGGNEIVEALAQNRATPKVILDELCKRRDKRLNRFLASNPSVDIYYLREFQLDNSLIPILAKNETYGKSVLQGLGI